MTEHVAYLHIRRLGTQEIVHSVGLKSTKPRYVEQVLRGMLINLKREEFYVDDSEADNPELKEG